MFAEANLAVVLLGAKQWPRPWPEEWLEELFFQGIVLKEKLSSARCDILFYTILYHISGVAG